MTRDGRWLHRRGRLWNGGRGRRLLLGISALPGGLRGSGHGCREPGIITTAAQVPVVAFAQLPAEALADQVVDHQLAAGPQRFHHTLAVGRDRSEERYVFGVVEAIHLLEGVDVVEIPLVGWMTK